MLAVGPSLLHDQLSVFQMAGAGRLVSAVGSVFVSHDLRHDWTAALSYRRGSGLSGDRSALNQAAIDVRGSAGRRVDLTLAGGYSDGEYGLSVFDKRNKTYFGSARLRMALTRRIAVYAESSLYQYDLRGLTSIPAGSPLHLDRRALRAGVTLWLPLLG
jgi:hypothetical protein